MEVGDDEDNEEGKEVDEEEDNKGVEEVEEVEEKGELEWDGDCEFERERITVGEVVEV